MDPIMQIVIVVGLVALFFYLGWLVNSKIGKNSLASADERAKQIVADGKRKLKTLREKSCLK